jgi:hypothetical protein
MFFLLLQLALASTSLSSNISNVPLPCDDGFKITHSKSSYDESNFTQNLNLCESFTLDKILLVSSNEEFTNLLMQKYIVTKNYSICIMHYITVITINFTLFNDTTPHTTSEPPFFKEDCNCGGTHKNSNEIHNPNTNMVVYTDIIVGTSIIKDGKPIPKHFNSSSNIEIYSNPNISLEKLLMNCNYGLILNNKCNVTTQYSLIKDKGIVTKLVITTIPQKI